MEKYMKEGQASGLAVAAIISLVVGVGVAVMVMIFIGALGGQTYNLVQADIDSISDATINASVHGAIQSSFEALEQTGDYLPLIVLAVVIFLVLSLVLGFTALGGMGGGRETAL